MAHDGEPTLTPAEARKRLGISPATYFRWLREGRLRGVRAGRRWRFPVSVIEGLLRSPGPGVREARRGLEEALGVWRGLLLGRGARKSEVDAMVKSERSNPGGEARALARLVLEHARRNRATAVHLEPGADGMSVRERIDGVLAPVERTLATAAAGEVVAALKGMAGLDPAPSRRAAHGRFFADVGGRRVDVVAATYPTGTGESLTLRLLDPEWTAPRLEELGYSPGLCAALRERMGRPRGVLVVNGPTDSGKTTTLYSLLVEQRRPDRKIMTAEDPIEVRFDGILQAEVGGAGGMGFADAVRAMLVHEVDVAMIAEIRTDDLFGLVFSLGASGRKALTVLHAFDAVGALHRIITMGGLKGSYVADTLLGILDQRLVRRTCPDCRGKTRLRPEEARRLGLSCADARREVAAGKGCPACRGTGFRGRTAVGALLSVTPALRKALEAGAGLEELRAAAADQPTLRDALRERVLAGEISPGEAVASGGAAIAPGDDPVSAARPG